MDEDRRRFVLNEYRTYSSLGVQVEHIRRDLAAGDDLAEVLVRESENMLDSGMTRGQLAAALASTLVRLASSGADLDVDPEWRVIAEAMLVKTPAPDG
jgi:hypothetical protein